MLLAPHCLTFDCQEPGKFVLHNSHNMIRDQILSILPPKYLSTPIPSFASLLPLSLDHRSIILTGFLSLCHLFSHDCQNNPPEVQN